VFSSYFYYLPATYTFDKAAFPAQNSSICVNEDVKSLKPKPFSFPPSLFYILLTKCVFGFFKTKVFDSAVLNFDFGPG
jgi:hypothetical protein